MSFFAAGDYDYAPAAARQESLYGVVRAYALYDREIGYCLFNLCSRGICTRDAEDAF